MPQSRFTIRRYRVEDVDAIYDAVIESREHVSKWMDWLTTDYSRETIEDWVKLSLAAWETGDAYEHLVIDRETKAIIGACGLNRVNKIDLVCNLGYWVRKSHLGQGAALEAVRQICDFAFKEIGLVRLEIVVAETNLASRRVAEKAGAIDEGPQRARIRIHGVSHNARMYALISPEAKRYREISDQ